MNAFDIFDSVLVIYLILDMLYSVNRDRRRIRECAKITPKFHLFMLLNKLNIKSANIPAAEAYYNHMSNIEKKYRGN